jgi:N-acetylglucosaminyldiphosphoundecaprenol N-acetyl-beta-D-mannosaminyltransferase
LSNIEFHETDILDCRIADMDENDACMLFFDRIGSGLKSQVFFINAHKIYLQDKHPHFADIIRAADYRFADGHSLLWAAGRLRITLLHKTTGVGLLRRMLENASAYGCRAFFLGAKKEVVEAAAARAKEAYGGCIAGFHDGYFGQEQNDEVIKEINASGAQMLFVGFGSPKQETWLHENAAKLKPLLLMGVGGSFDVLSGMKKRAPEFWSKHGLEWLWRFFQSPVKMARRVFIENLYFVSKVWGKKHKGLSNRSMV